MKDKKYKKQYFLVRERKQNRQKCKEYKIARRKTNFIIRLLKIIT